MSYVQNHEMFEYLYTGILYLYYISPHRLYFTNVVIVITIACKMCLRIINKYDCTKFVMLVSTTY